MLRHLLLLSPVYVTLFWAITLNTGIRTNTAPRSFLGKFMIFAFVIYLSNLLYFIPYPHAYVWIDPFNQLASLIVFPMYHIYFRLLTVDHRFSLSKHAIYLLPSVILFVLYSIGVIFSSYNDFSALVFHSDIHHTNWSIRYLKFLHPVIRIVFVSQVILTLSSNFRLINQHSGKAVQFYSDIKDTGSANVLILNISMIITGIVSIAISTLGRVFFQNKITWLLFTSVIFTSMLYLIGWLGNRQKSLNPVGATQPESSSAEDYSEDALTNGEESIIFQKLLHLLHNERIFLNSKLTIHDVAKMVGTNRTYISTVINHRSRQNFCQFVNGFRVDELEKTLTQQPRLSGYQLADICGFGSVDSMRRAVQAKTGLKIPEWKKQCLERKKTAKLTDQIAQFS